MQNKWAADRGKPGLPTKGTVVSLAELSEGSEGEATAAALVAAVPELQYLETSITANGVQPADGQVTSPIWVQLPRISYGPFAIVRAISAPQDPCAAAQALLLSPWYAGDAVHQLRLSLPQACWLTAHRLYTPCQPFFWGLEKTGIQ